MADTRDPVTIRKYANRRLYDTGKSAYVTLDDLAAMLRDGADFVVRDAKTGDDLTRAVLTQIVMEQEAKGPPLLSVTFLKDIVRFHGHDLGTAVPAYLDFSIGTLKREQERLKTRLPQGTTERPGAIAAQVRRNIEFFERAVGLISPTPEPELPDEGRMDELERIRHQLEAMQLQLDRLSESA